MRAKSIGMTLACITRATPCQSACGGFPRFQRRLRGRFGREKDDAGRFLAQGMAAVSACDGFGWRLISIEIRNLHIGNGMNNVDCSAAVSKGGFCLQRRLVHGPTIFRRFVMKTNYGVKTSRREFLRAAGTVAAGLALVQQHVNYET